MGHGGTKLRPVGQIIEHSRGQNFGPIFINLVQNDHLDNILGKFEYGHVGSKTRSVGQIVE